MRLAAFGRRYTKQTQFIGATGRGHFALLSTHLGMAQDLLRPPIGHPYPLIPIGGAVIRPADLIGANMRQLRLDCVAIPQAAFVEEA